MSVFGLKLEVMSGVVEYLVAPEFWAGGVILGLLGSIGTYFTTKAADKRKFSHDHDLLDRQESREDLTEKRKREREDKLREHESLYAVASEYTQVCTEILQNTIDTKGIFNTIRDMFYNQTGVADPNVEEKLAHAAKVTEENKRLMIPFSALRLVAPTNILDAASELNMAMLTVLKTTTEPFAAPVTIKAAGDRLNNFINVFRVEIGKEAYTESDAQRQALSFLDNLKKQVAAYMEEAKDEMKAAGFKTTPWDNM